MKTVSIYFVKTQLELLASELISSSFEADSFNIAVHQVDFQVKHRSFDRSIPFISVKEKGFLGTYKSIMAGLQNLKKTIETEVSAPDTIKIHLPRISTSKSNYSINFIKKSFPQSRIILCIIPHGLVSIDIIPLSFRKRIKFQRRRWNPGRLLFRDLKYYVPRNDLIGILDNNVKHIYTFPGMETNYPKEKVRLLKIEKANNSDRSKIAVVVGQPLLKDGFASKEDVELITRKIHAWVKEQNFDMVYYSKHPRAEDYLDFYSEDYRMLEQDGAIEPLLCEIQPEAIVSCYSTALAIGKSLLGDDVNCISIGLEHTNTDKKQELRRHFQQANIEVM